MTDGHRARGPAALPSARLGPAMGVLSGTFAGCVQAARAPGGQVMAARELPWLSARYRGCPSDVACEWHGPDPLDQSQGVGSPRSAPSTASAAQSGPPTATATGPGTGTPGS